MMERVHNSMMPSGLTFVPLGFITSPILSNIYLKEFDNIFYNREKIVAISAGIIPFYKSFESLQTALMISDHVPIYFEFEIK